MDWQSIRVFWPCYCLQNLVGLSKDKLAMRETCLKLSADISRDSVKAKPRTLNTSLDSTPSQRSSLPDISLTPRERQLLEQTSACVLDRHSHSSENVLKDTPPPKPPHPDRYVFFYFVWSIKSLLVFISEFLLMAFPHRCLLKKGISSMKTCVVLKIVLKIWAFEVKAPEILPLCSASRPVAWIQCSIIHGKNCTPRNT